MAGTRRPLIAGNWKMHGSVDGSSSLVSALKAGVGTANPAEMLVCPPFVYLDRAKQWLEGSPIMLGAQNVCSEPQDGALTGEVSARMLADSGCDYVIVGHSERRTLYHETDQVVVAKFAAVQGAGLIPILCVGESLEQREAGETEAIVSRQLEAVTSDLGVAALDGAVVAYEPIWAIGTGKTATPAQAEQVHAVIRGLVAAQDATIAAGLRILYGGSVKGANAAELLACENIDGGLVGGASLDAADFLKIFEAAAGRWRH
jgi:triosephosphate isomerase